VGWGWVGSCKVQDKRGVGMAPCRAVPCRQGPPPSPSLFCCLALPQPTPSLPAGPATPRHARPAPDHPAGSVPKRAPPPHPPSGGGRFERCAGAHHRPWRADRVAAPGRPHRWLPAVPAAPRGAAALLGVCTAAGAGLPPAGVRGVGVPRVWGLAAVLQGPARAPGHGGQGVERLPPPPLPLTTDPGFPPPLRVMTHACSCDWVGEMGLCEHVCVHVRVCASLCAACLRRCAHMRERGTWYRVRPFLFPICRSSGAPFPPVPSPVCSVPPGHGASKGLVAVACTGRNPGPPPSRVLCSGGGVAMGTWGCASTCCMPCRITVWGSPVASDVGHYGGGGGFGSTVSNLVSLPEVEPVC
jgi:hypothetical protein